MTANAKTKDPVLPAKRMAWRLRIIAVIVLLVGIAGAELIYWRGTGSADLPDDASLLGYDKAQARQIGTLFGQQGVLVQEWSDDLKHPGTRAIVIAVAAALTAAGCFYVARLLDSHSDGQHDDNI